MIETEANPEPQLNSWSKPHPEMDEKDHADSAYSNDSWSMWRTNSGMFVLASGVVLPLFTILSGVALSYDGIWRSMILHPIETSIESLLLLAVPLVNNLNWSSVCKNDNRKPVRAGILSGVAIAVPLITLAISVSALALNFPLIDSLTSESHQLSVLLLGLVSLLALSAGIFIANKIKSGKITRDAKFRTILYSLSGMALTMLSFVAAETRPAQIRIAESMALSDNASIKEDGLRILRSLDAEREIKLNCADQHTAGVAGMFLPLNGDVQRRLYFAATGKPYRDRQSTNMSLMSNEYLRRHVVGAPIEGLSLHRSAIHGELHPETLSSILNWTFVFKNNTYSAQEARAELALPEGAVISDLKLWIDGQPRSGAFSANETVKGAYNWVTVQHRDPALITDLGRGRYLLQVSPVPGRGEVKVSVAITEPLKVDGAHKAAVGMPHFIDSNFALSGTHQLRLRSNCAMASGLDSIKPSITADGARVLAGKLKESDISNSTFSVRLQEPVTFKKSAIKDPFSGDFIVQELKERTAQQPKHLVVVVDASQSMKGNVDKVVSALKTLPSQLKTSIVLAGDKDNPEPMDLETGLKELKESNFGGGQDNLQGILKAAEVAGESKGGTVLWIHGPQPGFNNEMYIMAPYAAAPKFYELALDDCLTDANEFFKNHREIGPFAAVERSGPLKDDLESFLSKWHPGAKETFVDSTRVSSLPADVEVTNDGNREVAVLRAASEVKQLIAAGNAPHAAKIGIRYHIVTPVSGAVVLENASDYSKFGMPVPSGTPDANDATQLANAGGYKSLPMLQGSTNGAIGPQGADATVIYGINTAGTVRVNNLANLEALLNIAANCGELIAVLLGLFNIVMGIRSKAAVFPINMSARVRVLAGLVMIIAGFMIPGMLNWMVASARDANLFD